MALTHCIFLELHLPAAQLPAAHTALQALNAQSAWPLHTERLAYRAAEQLFFAYLRLDQAQELVAADMHGLQAAWSRLAPGLPAVQASRLEQGLSVAGHDSGQPPLYHYVVETDPAPGWLDEILRWYDQEHMPGLSGVPGCTLAQRFINHDAGPRSHACYSLLTEDTLGSPPWMAVRNSDWSCRCRPHFTNTRRTMMAVWPAPAMYEAGEAGG